ncbi:hypothetical protein FPQ18DRAFT_335055 [Pyronema domesticum]|nr:hypothetical protein FPQ18DRAFT_335055 [Pyronema domesticum]
MTHWTTSSFIFLLARRTRSPPSPSPNLPLYANLHNIAHTFYAAISPDSNGISAAIGPASNAFSAAAWPDSKPFSSVISIG